MTIYLAVDPIAGISLPDGVIAGQNDRLSDLRAAGFANPPYSGNRRVNVDETDASVWNNDCRPGWYVVSGAVQSEKPLTSLERKQAALRGLHVQLHAWADGLDGAARGQPVRRVNAGHQWLYYKHYAGYLIGSNLVDGVTYSDEQIIAWANSSASGAQDTRSVAEFYAAEPLTGALADGPIGPMTWVNPATGAKLNLVNSQVVTPASSVDIDTVDLSNGAWIDALTS